MKKTTICIIAAVAESAGKGRKSVIVNAESLRGPKEKVIGIGNALPWNIPEDLQHFKDLTLSHPIIMGRKTFDSIGRPLPGRTNIVITRNSEWRHPECIRAESLAAAIHIGEQNIAETAAPLERKIFIIGGGQIYAEAMPLADRLYLTEVHKKEHGDAFFPSYEKNEWRQVDKSRKKEALPFWDGEKVSYYFVVYKRTANYRRP